MVQVFANVVRQYNCQPRQYSFLDKWLAVPEYMPWLEKSSNGDKAYCKYCKKDLYPRTEVLNSHFRSQTHQKNIMAENPSEPTELEKNVAIAKLKIAALYVDRNLPFLLCDYEIPVLKQIFHDSEILEELSFDRLDIKSVICQHLAPAFKKNLKEVLKTQKFSIIVDETTDVTSTHSLCIVVRYFDEKAKKIRESLWDLIEVYRDKNSLANAEQISQKIIKSFEVEEIPLENIFSFCSDTCNLMFGVFESVSTKLKCTIPNLNIIRCNAHIQHLAAQKSMLQIPVDIEGFLKDVNNYINGSAKKHKRWHLHQIAKGVKPINVLKPCTTRWLSIGNCITRLLQRWTALQTFFSNEIGLEKNESEKIFNRMQDPILLYYLQFLNFILTKFNINSSELQAITPKFTKSSDQMSEFYKDLLSIYMDQNYVARTKIDLTNPLSEQHNVPINKMQIGEVANNLMKDESIPNQAKIDFLKTCKAFVRTCCNEVKHRVFETDNDSMIDRSMFHPENALSERFHQDHPNLEGVLEKFSAFIADEDKKLIGEEWRSIMSYEIPRRMMQGKDIDEFWIELMDYTEENTDRPLFKNLSKFALLTLLIPNSNASAERLWSKLNFEKTKLRNRLHFSTLRSILFAAQMIRDQGGAIAFEPSEDMIIQLLRPSEEDSQKDGNESNAVLEEEDFEDDEKDPDIDQCILEDILYSRSKKGEKRGNDSTYFKFRLFR